MIKQHPLHCGLKRAAIFCLVTLFALTSRAQEPQIISQLSDDPDCKVWVDSVLSTLSIKEQLGQLMIYTLTPQDTKSNQALLKKVVKEYGVGGLLFRKGTLREHALMNNRAQELADIPVMITFDGEWGLAMRIPGTPNFPRNGTLGQIEDEHLLYEYGREVAREMRELKVHVNFAPVADVNTNPKNPVIGNRSFGDDPKKVARQVIAYAQGLEDGGVLSVSKHFPGHGDTDLDSHLALPTLNFGRERLDSIELYPFREAFKAGLGGVMVAHLDIPALEPERGRPASLSKAVVTDLLQNEMGFKGLIFTDALEMKGVANHTNVCLQALKAGNDMILVPPRIKEDVDGILKAIETGELPASYIREKCRKVLTFKYALGLKEKPRVNLSGLEQRINSEEAQELIERLKSAVKKQPEELGFNVERLSAIDTIVAEAIREGATPGCQVVVLKEGTEVYNKAYGHYTYEKGSPAVTKENIYDLASLTKTTATLLAIMKLYDKGLLNLSDYVSTYLPELKDTDKQNITINELLYHQSGLQSTLLFYKKAIDEEKLENSLTSSRRDANHTIQIGEKAWANQDYNYLEGLTSATKTAEHTLQISSNLWIKPEFRDDYLTQIAEAPLYSKRYRYSCVGFILLQKVVEAITKTSLDNYLAQEFYQPMGLKTIGYLPLKQFAKARIIPSANDPFLRKEELQGYVHDESAAFQGGISGNAGLFGNATEVAQIYQMLLNHGTLNGKRYISEATCKLFTTRVSRISRRGLGFDKPDTKNSKSSPCCESAPASVYGHTGFTGTCAWVDPDNQLVYVFLSNRTYPNAWNNKLSKFDIRTRIQQAIYDAQTH